MSNDIFNVVLQSDFQYTSADYKSGFSGDEVTELLQKELLEYQMIFEQGSWLDEEIQHIANELVETGKVFARNQGFGEGLSIGTRKSGRLKILGTGNLVNSIKANPVIKNGAKTIEFYNDARNERGQYYAGHLEYGFHDRGGNFVPARPFMRPAMYAVSEGSKGNFRQIMAGLLNNLWTGRGFQGISNLSVGRKSASPKSNFWGAKSFSGRLGAQSRLKELRGQSHRKQMSTMRTTNKNSKKIAKGYKLAANKRDYYKVRDGKITRKEGSSSSKQKSGTSKQKTGQTTPPKPKEGKIINGVHYKEFKDYVDREHNGGEFRKAKSIWDKH